MTPHQLQERDRLILDSEERRAARDRFDEPSISDVRLELHEQIEALYLALLDCRSRMLRSGWDVSGIDKALRRVGRSVM